jgi:hypothetical protein
MDLLKVARKYAPSFEVDTPNTIILAWSMSLYYCFFIVVLS